MNELLIGVAISLIATPYHLGAANAALVNDRLAVNNLREVA